LHWPLRRLLNDHRVISNATAGYEITDANLHQIAAAKFAVDRQIEKRAVSKSMLPIEHEADVSNLLGFERPLRPKLLPGVPCRSLLNRIV